MNLEALAEAALAPFSEFSREVPPRSELRQHITAAYRRPEPDCVPALIEAARLSDAVVTTARKTARRLVEVLRAAPAHGGVESLIREYALSSDEGVALMCLAEALL